MVKCAPTDRKKIYSTTGIIEVYEHKAQKTTRQNLYLRLPIWKPTHNFQPNQLINMMKTDRIPFGRKSVSNVNRIPLSNETFSVCS